MTVERDGAAEAYDCKWGARGHQRRRPPPARRRAVARRRRGRAADRSPSWSSTPGGRATSAWRTRPRRTRRPASSRSRRSTGWPGRGGDASPRPMPARAPYRVRFDECGPDGLHPDVGPAALRAGPGRVPLGGPWLRARLVRRARHHLAGPRGRGRGRRPDRLGAELVGTTQVVGWRRVWARRRTEFRDADGTLVALGPRSTGSCSTRRGAPTRIPAEFEPVFGAPPATFGLARVDLGRRRRPRRARSARRSGRRSSTRWTTSTTRSTPTGWTRRSWRPAAAAAVRAVPRLARLEYARAAEPGASVDAEVWRDGDAWSCRLGDADGDLLRARLEPLAGRRTGGRAPWRARIPRPGLDAPRRIAPSLLAALGDDDPAVAQRETPAAIRALVAEAGELLRVRPEPGEWSVLECVGHIVDSELVVRRARALDHRGGRARDRRLRPGALGGPARAQRGRPGAPHRDLRGAACREPRPLGAAAGGGPRTGRPPPRARPGELRDDVPPGRRARPRPPRPGAARARGGRECERPRRKIASPGRPSAPIPYEHPGPPGGTWWKTWMPS